MATRKTFGSNEELRRWLWASPDNVVIWEGDHGEGDQYSIRVHTDHSRAGRVLCWRSSEPNEAWLPCPQQSFLILQEYEPCTKLPPPPPPKTGDARIEELLTLIQPRVCVGKEIRELVELMCERLPKKQPTKKKTNNRRVAKAAR